MNKHKIAFFLCVTWLVVEPIFMLTEFLTTDIVVQRLNEIGISLKESKDAKRSSFNSESMTAVEQSIASSVVKEDRKSKTYSFCKKIKNFIIVGFDRINEPLFDYVYSDINSLLQRALGKRYHAKGYLRTENDVLVPCHKIDHEEVQIEELEDNIKRFKAFLDQEGVELLYIQRPSKKALPYPPTNSMDIDSLDRKADKFLNFCRLNDIEHIDLREELIKSGNNWDDAFYKTDHHWKAETGFWAFQIVANRLREKHNFSFDEKYVLSSSYNNVPNYQNNLFLGSFGKKTGQYFCSLDSITKIAPKFETRYTIEVFPNTEKIYPEKTSRLEGTFEEVCLFENRLCKTSTVCNLHTKSSYGYYSHSDNSRYVFNKLSNNNKTVLLVRDSYACVFSPFLYGICKEVHEIDLRTYHQESLVDYVHRVKPDVVIIMAGYLFDSILSFEEKSGLKYNER